MRCKRHVSMLIPCYVACCLYKQFAATEESIIRLHTPNIVIASDYVGLLQHNIKTLVKCKLLIPDLNATNKSDF